MAVTSAPGIRISEALRPSLSRRVVVRPPAPVLIGEASSGPALEPVLITTWREFSDIFGGFSFDPANSPLWLGWGVYQHFQSGGQGLFVIRVGGQNMQTAFVSVPDSTTEPLDPDQTQAFTYPPFLQPAFDGDIQPLPAPPGSFTVRAKSGGSSGNQISLVINDSVTGGNRFDVIVRRNGVDVERWTTLSMDPNDSHYFPGTVNSELAGSAYITVVDQTTATFGKPADGTYTMAGGSDGQAVTSTDYSTAINIAGAVEGSILLACPGVVDPAVQTMMINHCETRTNGFAILDAPNDVVASAVGHASALPVSSYGAVYYPWPVISDPSANRAGATRIVPPSGSVVGMFQRNDLLTGPQEAAAGQQAVIPNSLGLSQVVTLSQYGTLNDNHVNGIRIVPGGYAVNLYGVRTLRKGYIDQYINVRRSLIYIKQTLLALLQFAVFRNNDPYLWAQVTATCDEFLQGFWQSGGLRGLTVQEAYFITCDSSNNPTSTVEAGELHVDVGVALQTPAEFVIITIGMWDGGATVEEQGVN